MTAQFTPGIDFRFISRQRPTRYFLYRGSRLLVKTSNGRPVPLGGGDLAALAIAPEKRLVLGQIDGCRCTAYRLPSDYQPPPGRYFEGLRSLFGRLDDAVMAAAGYGLQILNWAEANQFCGRCGDPTVFSKGERALRCARCERSIFPQVSPAVIVAVVSRKRLLLARSGRFAGCMFSVIAGYVEPGETLEACVRREVGEEVGIQIGDICYFGSQSWPFSGSLMVGFTARHTGGAIAVDNKEIVEAGWFAADELPEIPGKMSIARQLIDWYVERYGSASPGVAAPRRGSS
jgi:NAD+ diphosphatase